MAAGADEIRRLRRLGLDEDGLCRAVSALGLDWLPPDGLIREEWLDRTATRIEEHLAASGYEPPPPPNPAYPAHDIRAYGYWERPEVGVAGVAGFSSLPGMVPDE